MVDMAGRMWENWDCEDEDGVIAGDDSDNFSAGENRDPLRFPLTVIPHPIRLRTLRAAQSSMVMLNDNTYDDFGAWFFGRNLRINWS